MVNCGEDHWGEIGEKMQIATGNNSNTVYKLKVLEGGKKVS